MKTVLAVAICSLSLAGCAGPQQAPPTPVAQAFQVAPAAVLSDECPSGGGGTRAPGQPADPHGIIAKSWPQDDSCVLIGKALVINNLDGFFSVPVLKPDRKLHNAEFVGRKLEVIAGGLLHIHIPDGMGVTTRAARAALLDASTAVRDAKEQLTGIMATVAATSTASNGELSELTVGIHRDRALAVREALDARLREIGQAVLRNLVPARQAGRESYLVWGNATGNKVTPVDSQGHQLSWGTHELVPDAPVVPMPPIET